MKYLRHHVTVVSLALVGAASGCIEKPDPATAVFDRGSIHKIELTVGSGFLEQLGTDLDNRVPCTVTYDGEVVENAGIRQKGNSTEPLTGKPSFSIKLDEFNETNDLFGLQKLILNNAKQDATLLREQIGADMFTRAGIPASRRAHAVVSLNGADLGVYVVAEAVDKDFLQIQFGQENDEGNLYEGPCCGDFVDDVAHMELEDEQKDGRSRSDIIALADVIASSPDDALAAAVDKRMDFGKFVTTYAIEALLDHWDGYALNENNFYMYNNPVDGRFVFIPHGMDRIIQDPRADTEAAPKARLPQRIREIAALDTRYHDELARVTREVWDEGAVLAGIDGAAKVIRSASGGDRTKKDVAEFEANLGALREAMQLRRDLVDPAIACGDGATGGLETCDDGNTTGGDGCSARCRLEN
jgi:spore coat protein H